MARITVEDCLDHVDNRFHLVMVASKRARQLSVYGADPIVDWDNDKPTVVALREIAGGHTDLAELEEKRIRGAVDHDREHEHELEQEHGYEPEQAQAQAQEHSHSPSHSETDEE